MVPRPQRSWHILLPCEPCILREKKKAWHPGPAARPTDFACHRLICSPAISHWECGANCCLGAGSIPLPPSLAPSNPTFLFEAGKQLASKQAKRQDGGQARPVVHPERGWLPLWLLGTQLRWDDATCQRLSRGALRSCSCFKRQHTDGASCHLLVGKRLSSAAAPGYCMYVFASPPALLDDDIGEEVVRPILISEHATFCNPKTCIHRQSLFS